jgi:hypothetical protein
MVAHTTSHLQSRTLRARTLPLSILSLLETLSEAFFKNLPEFGVAFDLMSSMVAKRDHLRPCRCENSRNFLTASRVWILCLLVDVQSSPFPWGLWTDSKRDYCIAHFVAVLISILYYITLFSLLSPSSPSSVGRRLLWQNLHKCRVVKPTANQTETASFRIFSSHLFTNQSSIRRCTVGYSSISIVKQVNNQHCHHCCY